MQSQNLIGTASIDTTCTIWDIEKETVFTQLIAHDKEVYDISFSPDKNLFASVGADGSARQFDLRFNFILHDLIFLTFEKHLRLSDCCIIET